MDWIRATSGKTLQKASSQSFLGTQKSHNQGGKNLLYKLITFIQGRAHDNALVTLTGPAHLASKSNEVLAAAIMAHMELDYMQRVAESDEDNVGCVLTTDAEAVFQSASRSYC